MRTLRIAGVIARHLWRLWRGGQVRFRLETYGLYYPSTPYTRAWWKISPRSLVLLTRQAPAYLRWIVQMESLRSGDAASWWSEYRRSRGGDHGR